MTRNLERSPARDSGITRMIRARWTTSLEQERSRRGGFAPVLVLVLSLTGCALPPSASDDLMRDPMLIDSMSAPHDAADILDDFERVDWPDPNLWYLPDEPTWRPSGCRSTSGTRSLRAFGGQGDVEAPCDAPVLDGDDRTSSIDLKLDLREAATTHRLDLEFELSMALPSGGAGMAPGALFITLYVLEGSSISRVTVFGATSDSGVWARPRRRLDLTALADVTDPGRVYDLRGGQWVLNFTAVRRPAARGDVFIDDLTLLWEPDLSVPTTTERPPSTATPTSTPRATFTPLPTETPEPTPTLEAPSLYLPRLLWQLPVPEPSAEPTLEITAEATAEGTAEPSAVPTAEHTATPVARRYLPIAETIPPREAYPGP